MKQNIVVHVGLAKCGTKFLQRSVFPYIENINYCWSNLFDARLCDDKINLFSSEKLSGHLIDTDPRIKKDVYPEENGTCKYVYARRIKSLYPDARIIIVTRGKEGLIRSSYNESVRHGNPIGYDEFKKRVLIERSEELDIDKYVSFMKNNFKDVCVGELEDLQNDANRFISDICDFIGCNLPMKIGKNPNKSFNDVQLKFALMINKISKNSKNKNGLFPLNKFITVDKIIRPYYYKLKFVPNVIK